MEAADSDETPAGPSRVRIEVTASFESAADAEAAGAAVERRDDGSMVLGYVDDEVTLEVLATDSAITWLLDDPAVVELVTVDDTVYDKDLGSCVGYCGEWAEVCGCDYWCFLFGDCCYDYYDVCE